MSCTVCSPAGCFGVSVPVTVMRASRSTTGGALGVVSATCGVTVTARDLATRYSRPAGCSSGGAKTTRSVVAAGGL